MIEHADKFRMGVVVPSTNTVAEDEYDDARPADVSLHSARLHVTDPRIGTDDELGALVAGAIAAVPRAIAELLTMQPDHLVIGMSIETLWGGTPGAVEFRNLLDSLTDLPVTTPADACVAGLETVEATRIGLVTPYTDQGNLHLTSFLEDRGFEVRAVRGPSPAMAADISRVRGADLVPMLHELKETGVDGILQFCTNLPFSRLADEASRWLDVPVLSINTTTFWHALRSAGRPDRVGGCGPLLARH